MRAAIYARFSTDKQTESSIVDQRRVCAEYAAREGLTITEQFEDQGISGAAIGNRPGFLEMLRAAQDRRFDVLMVMDLSRLSRSVGDLAKTIDRLVFAAIRVIGVHDGFDSAREGSELIAGMSGIVGQQFRAMVAKKTYAALESRAKTGRPAGGRAYGYRNNEVDKAEACIVREIFGRFAEGESFRSIASDLNRRNIPSPGSSWARKERRCAGWAGSGVRAILLNPRYAGQVIWNQTKWWKDPDLGKRVCRERPRSEWIVRRDEALRIVSDELFDRAQRRFRPAPTEKRQRSGGHPKYLLSGLLKCGRCGAHYVGVNGSEYGCSAHRDGNACDNAIRVKRTQAEDVLVGTFREQALSAQSVSEFAEEWQRHFAALLRERESRSEAQPREVAELDARIARLRQRLRDGDPDMSPDELQGVIERAEAKRRELVEQQPAMKAAAKVIRMLPNAAARAQRVISEALAGDMRASLKARAMLREAFNGEIVLEPREGNQLWTMASVNRAAPLRLVGTSGSGGRI